MDKIRPGLIVSILFIFYGAIFYYGGERGNVFSVNRNGMAPFAGDRDLVVISRSYDVEKRGDVIVFESDPMIKNFTKGDINISRLIGLPGENISYSEGNFYIDNKKIIEKYLKDETDITTYRLGFRNVLIPVKHYFVMGDNRNNSLDSRSYGPIQENLIVGKVICVYHLGKHGILGLGFLGMLKFFLGIIIYLFFGIYPISLYLKKNKVNRKFRFKKTIRTFIRLHMVIFCILSLLVCGMPFISHKGFVSVIETFVSVFHRIVDWILLLGVGSKMGLIIGIIIGWLSAILILRETILGIKKP